MDRVPLPRRRRPLQAPAFGRTALVAVLLGALAPVVWAGDDRPVEIPLTSGQTIQGVVKAATGSEVLVSVGSDEIRRIPWTRLTPLGLYRVKAALAPPADGKVRMKLAELAADLGLHEQARMEYEKAYALGALNRKQFEAIVRAAERDAVASGVRQAEKLAEDGDLEAAWETARKLRTHFANAPNAGAINKLINDLVARVQKLDREATKAREELELATLEVARNKEILKRKTEAVQFMKRGQEDAVKAHAAMKKGSITRVAKQAEAADEQFRTARRHLGRLRRILRRDSDTRKEVLAKLNELDEAQFDLLHKTAWFMYEQTVWSKAERFAARASYIDPVHPELMDLRDLLVEGRIRYRISDVTNARPIIR